MSMDKEATETIMKVVDTCVKWQLGNNEKALQLDSEGLADADEFGMHTLTAGVITLWNLYVRDIIVQPEFELQRHLGIIAGESARWQRNTIDEVKDSNELFGIDAMTMAFLRLYKEVLDRGIIRPPTHLNSTTIN